MSGKPDRFLVRVFDVGVFLEYFMFSAALSVVGTRAYLAVMDYPVVGSGIIHVAHVLWGGILMMIATFIILIFHNREMKVVGTLISGVGFGLFVDEIGKFITKDNDYFFQPTISIIYVLFITLYIIVRYIDAYQEPSDTEYAANAIDVLKEAAIVGMDTDRKRTIQSYLSNISDKHTVANAVHITSRKISTRKSKKVGAILTLEKAIRLSLDRFISHPLFGRFVISSFSIVSAISVYIFTLDLLYDRSFVQLVIVASSTISMIIVLLGMYYYHHDDRLSGYRMLELGLKVSIFVTNIFLLYRNQLGSFFRVIVAVVVWTVLQYAIENEKRKQSSLPK